MEEEGEQVCSFEGEVKGGREDEPKNDEAGLELEGIEGEEAVCYEENCS